MLIDEFGYRVDNKVLESKIIFYGASTRNQKVIDKLNIQKNVLFFVDSDEKKKGQKLGDYFIKSVDNLADKTECVIVSVLVEHMKDISKRVGEYGICCFFYLFEQFDIEKIAKSNWNIFSSLSFNYKYIHFFANQKFLRPFYDMVEERMNISEHLFIVDYYIKEEKYGVLNDMEKKNTKYHNVLFFDDVHSVLIEREVNCNFIYEDEKMKDIFRHADKILLHSIAFGNTIKEKLSQWVNEFGNKMVWLSWGGDCNYRNDTHVINILNKIKCSYTCQAMVDIIWRNYGVKANSDYCHLSYCYIPYDKISDIHCKKSECRHILLGHSAAKFVNHILGLDLLYQWRNENIRIYCPLSYGAYDADSFDYRNLVIEKGREMFGNKFIPMLDFMEIYQYYDFLDAIDVAIFPMQKMAAGTTLTYLAAHNKKIYLNRKIMECFDYANIYAEDIELIREQDFEEFIQINNFMNTTIDINKINDINVNGWIKLLNDK